MIDAFLIFLLYSQLPLLFPTSLSPTTEKYLFMIWAVGQVVLLVAVIVYLVWRTLRTRWSTRITVLVWLLICIAAGLSYLETAWDSVVVYDRIVKLALQYKGLWAGFTHAGTPYVFGYPPGATLSVMWGRLLALPSSNMANAALLWLWMTNWLIKYVEPEGNWKSAPLFVSLFALAPQVFWHVVYFYNNILYGLVWMTLVAAPLFRQRMRAWELCGYSLLLVWFRPQLMLALVPILSAAVIEALLARTDRRRVAMFMLAVVVAFAGAKFWDYRMAQLEELQRQHLLEDAATQSAGRDAAAIEAHFVAPEQHTVVSATPAQPRSQLYRTAIVWAYRISMQTHATALIGLMLLALYGWSLGRRWGLASLLPVMTPLTFIVGTARFAEVFPDYQSIPGSLQRLHLSTSLVMVALAVALEAQRARRDKTS